MRIEIPLKKLLRTKKYHVGDRLYSTKTGKFYGEVLMSQFGDRAAEYVYVRKANGKNITTSRTRLDKIVKIGEEEEQENGK